ncbi:hypothetical protein [Streptomyces sp. H39-C1]|uniref:hypothetical protein n=1 Tax=Streptomyces sp. H39-C1 TaxID=3004355 RepID=UPI0022AEFB75|nr:hypothetical protein [Streptomyces sp. H39-C1]MCZ4098031.1 hypothetical protein [Streptomyces sp. H39-C1]
MTANFRDTVASAMIEGASMASALIGGAAGAYIGHQLTPTTWSATVRLLFAGAVAVVGAVTVDALAELVLVPLRRLLMTMIRSTTRSSAPASANTLGEALAQVAIATAHRAANAAHRID